MIRCETVYLVLGDRSVFIKKSISIVGTLKKYTLSVHDFVGGYKNNEKVGNFKYLKDMNKIFDGVVETYKNRGYK